MTVAMIRTADGKTADVHPDEVENWSRAGWEIAQADESEPDDGFPPSADMRAAIKAETGKAPGPRTSRESLIEQFNALPKGDA